MGPRGSETLAFTRMFHVESGILREEYIVLSRSKRDNVEKKLQEWTRAIEEIRRKTTVVLRFTGDGDSRMETLGSVL